ncbi:NUDIX domain-containing protein [Phytohabitans rumicis]|uniref:NUDIX hydrolase n=1 Tax=Phytohabitans rumicis TaxID=1076125 RepID=A0A6V8L4S0_9ACTN|nr:NUDIX domain-containing protein [Phytohabitans rumicis]GFJ89126.1 NUDIX hydrolase [Phytohabitans rumicis]
MAAVTPIRAAGGVVWRPAAGGVEVCLVHRPRYDDWSLPKGKLMAREHPLAAAVREVAEETGVRGQPQVRLPSAHYRRDGIPKVVDYWSMRALSVPRFRGNAEVDRLRWLPPEQAARRLTYPHDARVLRHFVSLPAITAVQVLVRHGQAGKRGAYPGPDSARPLDPVGRAQARALAPLLALVAPDRLVSASPRRCTQTLDPLVSLVELPIEADPSLNEPKPGQDPIDVTAEAAGRLIALATDGVTTVVCSQGKVIPGALARMAALGSPKAWTTPKGTGWLLAYTGPHLTAADRLTP